MIPISVVDAFASATFTGNPAAVVRLPAVSTVTDDWLQQVAAEFNLSETAFVAPGGDGAWALRWFTPRVEVDLCGHATLAAAHALWEADAAPVDQPIVFQTRSGRLTCRPDPEGVAMDFPARFPEPTPAPTALLEGLRLPADALAWVGRGGEDVLVEVGGDDVVAALRPDFVALARVPCRGVIVTARGSDPRHDFVSRFFAPAVGIDEDPVTGSAHCALAVHWGRNLGRTTLRGWQASARGGTVGVRWQGDRVTLVGQARTAWRGEWLLPGQGSTDGRPSVRRPA